MRTGIDIGGKEQTTLLVFCPLKGASARQAFVSQVMADAGYDVVVKPVSKEICGSNPVTVVLDDWPRDCTKRSEVHGTCANQNTLDKP